MLLLAAECAGGVEVRRSLEEGEYGWRADGNYEGELGAKEMIAAKAIVRRAKIIGFHECAGVVRDGVVAGKNHGRLEARNVEPER